MPHKCSTCNREFAFLSSLRNREKSCQKGAHHCPHDTCTYQTKQMGHANRHAKTCQHNPQVRQPQQMGSSGATNQPLGQADPEVNELQEEAHNRATATKANIPIDQQLPNVPATSSPNIDDSNKRTLTHSEESDDHPPAKK